jgi:RNA polymerase sigma-70 factor (ECF subfamily)
MCKAVDAESIASYRTFVRRILAKRVKDYALADDLSQDVLLRAMRAAGAMRGDASPTTWLTAIALNVVRDHFRAARRAPPAAALTQAEQLPAPAQPELDLLKIEMSDCILGHVARLPGRQRDAVLMNHFAGFGHCEIGTALGISEANARVVLHRGLKTLRTSLTRECNLDFDDDIPCDRR